MQRLGPDPSPRALLRAATGGALPSHEDSRTYTLLFFSFYIAAMTDPNLVSADALEAPEWTVQFAAELIRQAIENGQARERIKPDTERYSSTQGLLARASEALDIARAVGCPSCQGSVLGTLACVRPTRCRG